MKLIIIVATIAIIITVFETSNNDSKRNSIANKSGRDDDENVENCNDSYNDNNWL